MEGSALAATGGNMGQYWEGERLPSQKSDRILDADEHPNQRILIMLPLNRKVSVKAPEILKLLSNFGNFGHVSDMLEQRGMIYMTFDHQEAADRVRWEIDGETLNGVQLKARYAHQSHPQPAQNAVAQLGTLLVLCDSLKSASQDVDSIELRRFLEQWGPVEEIRRLRVNHRGRFVTFKNVDDSLRALRESSDLTFKGMPITLTQAHEPHRPTGPQGHSNGRDEERGGFGSMGRPAISPKEEDDAEADYFLFRDRVLTQSPLLAPSLVPQSY